MDVVVLVLQSWRGPQASSVTPTAPCKTGLNRSGTSSRLRLGKLPFSPRAPVTGLLTFASSPEIVKLRESNAANNVTAEPEFEDPGYRALVEENIKESVSNVANDPVMQTVRLFVILVIDCRY